MMSTTALHYFSEVARCGSFRSAAEQLFVAASALSRQVGLLEEDVGAPLFERGRGRKSLRLTAAGELLMRYVHNVDGEGRRVRSDIEALKGLRKGEIRFGMPETFVREFIPDFLAKFNRLYPAITYQIEVAGTLRLLEMVASDELEATLSFNAPPMAEIKHVFELSLPTRLLVSTDHPLATKESVRLSDLADYGLALPDRSISAKWGYDDMFAKAKLRPRTTLLTNSYELMRTTAAAGMAAAIVNDRLSLTPGKNAGYRYIPIRDTRVKPQRLTLCVHDGRNLPVATLTFIEHLKKELSLLEIS